MQIQNLVPDGAFRKVRNNIDRLFDKNLADLIRGIRNNKENEVFTFTFLKIILNYFCKYLFYDFCKILFFSRVILALVLRTSKLNCVKTRILLKLMLSRN